MNITPKKKKKKTKLEGKSERNDNEYNTKNKLSINNHQCEWPKFFYLETEI
jgi:hypothetical protein